MQDIEELHREALRNDEETYIEPSTGLTVFTELFHLRRGHCCGNKCRHCPYNDWSTGKPIMEKRDQDEKNNDNNNDESIFDSQQELQSSSATNSRKAESAAATTTGASTKKKLHVPYTRTGDQGTSQLLTGERRSKADPIFEALGTVDELCAVVGVAHALITSASSSSISSPSSTDQQLSAPPQSFPQLEEQLVHIMSRLFDVGSHVAKPKPVVSDEEDSSDDGGSTKNRFVADGIGGGFNIDHVKELEGWIDEMTADLPVQRSFILPTGTLASSQFHVGRCVCRRAERSVIELVLAGVCDPNAMKYLNRLSDYLFVAARWINMKQGGDELAYKRPFRGATQRVATKEEKS